MARKNISIATTSTQKPEQDAAARVSMLHLIDEYFGSGWFFNRNHGSARFEMISWRGAAHCLETRGESLDALASTLGVSPKKLAAFFTYLSHGAKTYGLETDHVSVGALFEAVTRHAVTHSLE